MICRKTEITGLILVLSISVFIFPALADDGFTQSDRERLVRLEATLTTFMQQTDKRFDELRADMNARFEQVDKRIEDMRSDMNARFEQMTNMFYALSAIFTTLFAAVFGFAWWDRRSVLITAKKTARQEAEETTRHFRDTALTVDRLVEALRAFAEKTPELKEMLRRVNLL